MKRSSWVTLLVFSFLLSSNMATSQNIWQPVEDDRLHEFFDELANDGLIDLSTVAKPYSREEIYTQLFDALKREELLPRQRNRIKIYLDDFGFDGQLNDSLNIFNNSFTKNRPYEVLPPRLFASNKWSKVMIRPIYGIRGFRANGENFYASYGGAELLAYLGKGFAIYGSIRDNFHQKFTLADPEFLTREMGGAYKRSLMGREGGDFSESRGGITYSWEWGSVGFVKEHIQWGNHYGGANIFSGRSPSFPMITLDIEISDWLDFKYYHGWLVSEVIDSSLSYQPPGGNPYRSVFRKKQIAANLFTIRPFSKLNVSFGNSIVYGDVGTQAAYLIPFMFFKSVDHTLNEGIDNQNSQMFLDISYRGISHLHLFTSLFIDEFSITRISDPDRRNFYSFKTGMGLSNWPLKNIGIEFDYTITSPLTYRHRLPTITFESNEFNLGHFMRDNARSIYSRLWWRPSAKYSFDYSMEFLQKGAIHNYSLNNSIPLDEYSFLDNIIWSAQDISFSISYHPLSNFSVFTKFHFWQIQMEKESIPQQLIPSFQQSNTSYAVIGIQYGFQ